MDEALLFHGSFKFVVILAEKQVRMTDSNKNVRSINAFSPISALHRYENILIGNYKDRRSAQSYSALKTLFVILVVPAVPFLLILPLNYNTH